MPNFDTTNSYENSPTGTNTATTATAENILTDNKQQQLPPCEKTNHGMTMQEIDDPNKVTVTVADYQTPLVILFGPPTCGKTMTLVRLSRYLQKNGYTISPVSSFRPAYDKHYVNMCQDFNKNIASNNAAKGTQGIKFMLVEISKDGRPICQILEAPGEHYFDPRDSNSPFPAYINAIMSSQNRKIWTIMLEPHSTNASMDVAQRRLYVNRIAMLKRNMNSKDKTLFLFNKIDETNFVRRAGEINYKDAMQNVEYLYPGMLKLFRNENPVTKIWAPYDFSFLAFSTGTYNQTTDSDVTFTPGPDIYPKQLWKQLLKLIKG